jgi:DNA-binding response OmpR family regulator
VLVIEDEKLIGDLLLEHLAGDGYTPTLAASIVEARAQLGAAAPSLIVLDLMLSGRSGWDFLRERSSDLRLSNIPVLVISAAPRDRLLEAKELGADAFLSKPFDLDVFGALVRSFVR